MTDLDGHRCHDVVEWERLDPDEPVEAVGVEDELSVKLGVVLGECRRCHLASQGSPQRSEPTPGGRFVGRLL
jgi:hypothetical protein